MDNASNCDTTATRELPKHISTFRGKLSRGRCFAHTVQLMVKVSIDSFFMYARHTQAILDYFDTHYKPKKRTVVVAGTQSSDRTRSGPVTTLPSAAESRDVEVTAVEGEEYHGEDAELADIMEASLTAEEKAIIERSDAGQSAHDEAVVSMIRERATREMAARGVVIPDAEMKAATKIFPKISGLAVKVRDSAVVRYKWRKVAEANPPNPKYGSDLKYLATRNKTRWDSEFSTLNSHRAFLKAVDIIVADKDLKLQTFKLTAVQKTLASDLHDMLAPFKKVMAVFQSHVTLIIDVLPVFLDLELRLQSMSNDARLLPVCRVAAHAGLLQCQKYFILFQECEAVAFSNVCCPDRKLAWFRDRGWSDDQIDKLREGVITRFNKDYKSAPDNQPAAHPSLPDSLSVSLRSPLSFS
ncbi:uncharacterized protein STEHIDRAFT_49378 [Stereum hirsutum FP-91666 SS1]|uniref:uncharacterized protein n=1 Tax=Stereum hirsutum (strain FP-91666) TaxID=721885 RepID=UPI000440C464|nr:uncharacterized protein STEHIDRAFT_49378 [Stereum hirsutum FP-91666 SS1]EIM91657.1 hypothetical protein STEHIDRAFT_49378 [Stereum hirsutum FP-91666 SS1]